MKFKSFSLFGKSGRHRQAFSIGETLRKYQKMEVVTELMSGLVHDFGNLLFIIKSNCDLLLTHDLPPHVYASIQGMRKAATQGCSFADKLLAFVRGESVKISPLNIDVALKEMEVLLRLVLRPNLQLDFELNAQKALTAIDQTCLQQVVLNLVLNSRDALSHGGVILVRTCTLPLSGKTSLASSLPAGNYVLLQVSDNGCGMEKEVGMRAFEPFFTTKSADRSKGLGLAVVKRIASLNGGEVQIRTAPELGTTVRVLLPDISQIRTRETAERFTAHPIANKDAGNDIPLLWSSEEPEPELCYAGSGA